MTDDRLIRAFRGLGGLDVAIEPEPVFRSSLYEHLATNLGFRGAPAVATRPASRLVAWRRELSRRLRPDIGVVAPRTLRLAYLAAMLALLLVAMLLVAVVAGLFRSGPSPAELVLRSQRAWADPPAVVMSVRDPLGQLSMLSSDGEGTWRVEPAGEPGSYYLYDGSRSAHYDANLRTWGIGLAAMRGGPPWPFMNEFTWSTVAYEGATAIRTAMPCAGATLLGEATTAGRTTDHLVCTDIDMEYWIDRETGLVLRMEAGPTTPNWQGAGDGVVPAIEVVAFNLGGADPSAFTWTAPAGSFGEDEEPASRVLTVGDRATPWKGATTDGAPFDTAATGYPAAYLFTAPGAGTARRTLDPFAAAAASHPAFTSVVVMLDQPGTVTGYLSMHPTSLPVIADPDAALAQLWGMGYPSIVLFGADGRVAAIFGGGISVADANHLFDAAASGAPIPSIEAVPAATLWPIVEGVTGFATGDLLPEWSAPRLAGGTLESKALRGRPTILWFWVGGTCEGCQATELEAAARLARDVGGKVNVVIVSEGELRTGYVAELFANHGIDVPLVFDWDTVVFNRLRMNLYGTLVVDASGRLVQAQEFPPSLSDLRALFPRLGLPAAS